MPDPGNDAGAPAPDPIAPAHPDTERAEQLQRQLDRLTEQHAIERQLSAAGVSDLESARLLVRDALEQSDQPDITRAVADIKQRKPHLFEPPATPPSTMAPLADPDPDPGATLKAAANAARRTGNLRALMVYMRHRRDP